RALEIGGDELGRMEEAARQVHSGPRTGGGSSIERALEVRGVVRARGRHGQALASLLHMPAIATARGGGPCTARSQGHVQGTQDREPQDARKRAHADLPCIRATSSERW